MIVTKIVQKVMLFIFRTHLGEKQFYILYRPESKAKDTVVPTGHIADNIPDETPEAAAKRELNEELGAEAISIKQLNYKVETLLSLWNKRSVEQAFLIEVPDQDYPFLEGVAEHSWVSIDELSKKLTYDSQFSAVTEIKEVLEIK